MDFTIFSPLYDCLPPIFSVMEIPELLDVIKGEFGIAIDHGLKLLSCNQHPMNPSDPGMMDFLNYVDSREIGSQALHVLLEKIKEARDLDVSLTDQVKRDLLDANLHFKDLQRVNRTLKAKFN